MPSVKEITDLIIGKYKKSELELIEKAYAFAEKAHEGMKRLSGEPYFTHVVETAKNLASLRMDAQTVAAGLLPDVLEDTATTEEALIKEKKKIYEKNLAEVRQILEKELAKNKIKYAEISYRMKHKYSLYKKLLKYEMDIEKIYDIVALRVVVDTVEECYRILGIIHSIWNPMPGRIKDYIAVPKPNGYRSIHTTIFTGI